MNKEITKNNKLEEWAVAHEQDVKERSIQWTRAYYKDAVFSNSIWLSVFILVTIGLFSSFVRAIDSYGDNGLILLVLLGLIEVFYLVTGLAFSLPSMLKRCVVNYWEIQKGNCHAVITRCVEISSTGETGWHPAVFEGIHGEIETESTFYISDDEIDSYIGILFCMVYVKDKCARRYCLEEIKKDMFVL